MICLAYPNLVLLLIGFFVMGVVVMHHRQG